MKKKVMVRLEKKKKSPKRCGKENNEGKIIIIVRENGKVEGKGKNRDKKILGGQQSRNLWFRNELLPDVTV